MKRSRLLRTFDKEEATPGTISLYDNEKKVLVGQLANQATLAPFALGAKGYMRYLINKTNWPEGFKGMRVGALAGIAKFDAQELVNWAVGQGGHPQAEGYTVIGGLLEVLIEDVGLEDAEWITALIAARDLLDDSVFGNLKIPVPQRAREGGPRLPDMGPDIEWHGPTDEKVLEGYIRPEPAYDDVGWWRRAIKRAESVCLIEYRQDRPEGTGFLIDDDKVLTNYHVLKHPDFPGDDLRENASKARLYFGRVTMEGGQVTEGREFKPVGDTPVLARSPVDTLDYVLLQVEKAIISAEGIGPAPYDLELPKRKTQLHMIGHPGGGDVPMKIARSRGGVTWVGDDEGLVQYWTRSDEGSSGSPCFNEDWKVVALHHARVSKFVGSRKEGILIRAIYEEIKQHLPKEQD